MTQERAAGVSISLESRVHDEIDWWIAVTGRVPTRLKCSERSMRRLAREAGIILPYVSREPGDLWFIADYCGLRWEQDNGLEFARFVVDDGVAA